MIFKIKKRRRRKKRKPIKKRTLFVLVAMLNLTWFAAWTVELGLLAGFKIKEKASGDDAAG